MSDTDQGTVWEPPLAGSGPGEGGPDVSSPAAAWELDTTRRALDDLFVTARQFARTEDYKHLLDFVARFRSYSPFNAMLVQFQMPGARFVAPAYRWWSEYGRLIKPGARPLVILQPMGPVMFVFDVSETEPGPNPAPLPDDVLQPFAVGKGRVGGEYDKTVQNAQRDGILVTEQDAGSQSAGMICTSPTGRFLDVQVRWQPAAAFTRIPVRYDVLLNAGHPTEVKYTTLVHELAHLYCGHLGTPQPKWWPDRRGLGAAIEEFEAESVSFLVCQRLGIETPSADYLAGYVKAHTETPRISLECVMKTAGLIEQMGRERLALRKDR